MPRDEHLTNVIVAGLLLVLGIPALTNVVGVDQAGDQGASAELPIVLSVHRAIAAIALRRAMRIADTELADLVHKCPHCATIGVQPMVMTVKELIEFLQTQPPDALCLIGEGYEPSEMQLFHDVKTIKKYYTHDDGEWKLGPAVLFGH